MDIEEAIKIIWLYATQQREYNDETLHDVHEAIYTIQQLYEDYKHVNDKLSNQSIAYGNRILYSKHLERAIDFLCKHLTGMALPWPSKDRPYAIKAGYPHEWKAYAMKETEDKELSYEEDDKLQGICVDCANKNTCEDAKRHLDMLECNNYKELTNGN